MLLVEFTGLPGAGKTLVCKLVSSQLNALGFRCMDRKTVRSLLKQSLGRWEILKAVAIVCFQYRHAIAAALAYWFQITPRSFASLSRVMGFFKTLAYVQMVSGVAKRKGYSIILMDQGVLQAVWSMVIHGQPPARFALERFLEGIARKVRPAFVFFDIDSVTAAHRVQQRSTRTSRFDHMGFEQAERLLAQYEPYLHEIVDVFRQVAQCQVLRVQGTQEPLTIAAAIVDFVRAQSELRCEVG